jgi:hypothetical protein
VQADIQEAEEAIPRVPQQNGHPAEEDRIQPFQVMEYTLLPRCYFISFACRISN